LRVRLDEVNTRLWRAPPESAGQSRDDVLREAIDLYALGDPKRRKLAMNLAAIERSRRDMAQRA
jgi:hypothetical protein